MTLPARARQAPQDLRCYGCAILAPCQQVGPGRDENGGGAGLITVRQVPATCESRRFYDRAIERRDRADAVDHATLSSAVADAARADFDNGVWSAAYWRFSAADRDDPLGPDDLERLAVAAQLVGEDETSASCWERAHL